MPQADLSREFLKQAMKEAVAEALNEQRDLLREIVSEVVEDLALVSAIEEGRATKTVERSRILDLLDHRS